MSANASRARHGTYVLHGACNPAILAECLDLSGALAVELLIREVSFRQSIPGSLGVELSFGVTDFPASEDTKAQDHTD
jgi:hypothetical protein